MNLSMFLRAMVVYGTPSATAFSMILSSMSVKFTQNVTSKPLNVR